MVLPVILTAGVVAGGVTGYATYSVGQTLALGQQEIPPKTGLGFLTGAATSIATYSYQKNILNKRFAHLLTYEVPAKVEQWGFRDFLRVTGPFIGTRVLMFSTSLAFMGFVSTKVDLAIKKK